MTRQKDYVCSLKSVRSNRFLYDGWNLIAELNATNNNFIRGYLWGVDLSGSLQGAGGVGGLIAVKEETGDAHFAAYDGNGNVIALVNATTGTYSAQYEYEPFGQTIRATGPMAESNPYRFSTKYQDEGGGFYYYGYRYYSPSVARWLNRDPIADLGFIFSLVEGAETKILELVWKESPATVNVFWQNAHIRKKIGEWVLQGGLEISKDMLSGKNQNANSYCFLENNPQNYWDTIGLCACPCPGGRWSGSVYGYVTAIGVGWGWFGGTLKCDAASTIKAPVSISVGALGAFVGAFVGWMDVNVSGAPCPSDLSGKHVHGWFVGYNGKGGKVGIGGGNTGGGTYGLSLAAWIPGTIQ